MSLRKPEVIVMGSGPAAMLCALAAARDKLRVHLFVLERNRFDARDFRSVEAVPAGLMALLIEFGIVPSQMGIFASYSNRLLAWETEVPVASACPPTVYLERPALDRALFAQMLRYENIGIEPFAGHAPSWDGLSWKLGNLEATYFIDATGRRAFSAQRRIAPAMRWFACVWEFAPRSSNRASSPLAIASLSGGYVYRIASPALITLGAVGPRLGKVRRFDDLRAILEDSRAGWIASGLSAPSHGEGSCMSSNVQWSSDDDCASRNLIRIGDASLAREPLASQGISIALSDALYAIAAINNHQLRMLQRRQAEQRARHLDSLRSIIARGRHRGSPDWDEYHKWIAGHTMTIETQLGLRNGRLEFNSHDPRNTHAPS